MYYIIRKEVWFALLYYKKGSLDCTFCNNKKVPGKFGLRFKKGSLDCTFCIVRKEVWIALFVLLERKFGLHFFIISSKGSLDCTFCTIRKGVWMVLFV